MTKTQRPKAPLIITVPHKISFHLATHTRCVHEVSSISGVAAIQCCCLPKWIVRPKLARRIDVAAERHNTNAKIIWIIHGFYTFLGLCALEAITMQAPAHTHKQFKVGRAAFFSPRRPIFNCNIFAKFMWARSSIVIKSDRCRHYTDATPILEHTIRTLLNVPSLQVLKRIRKLFTGPPGISV